MNTRSATFVAFAFALAFASSGSPSRAQVPRLTAVQLYGLTGQTQAVGIRHGFHIEMVQADSPAAMDKLRPGDVIVEVEGDEIRSGDHLRAVMAEALLDDGEIAITFTRGTDLVRHKIRAHMKPEAAKVATKRHRQVREGDDR